MNRLDLESILTFDEKWLDYNIYIWGTGNTASLYQEGFNRLSCEGFSITGYGDNNKSKIGTYFAGKKVFSAEEIGNADMPIVLIASPQVRIVKAITEQMKEIGILSMPLDAYILKKHKEQVLECYDSLVDERSKEVYADLIKCRIEAYYPQNENVDRNQYFSYGSFGEPDLNEVFVDCGAFVGDSIERYILEKEGMFKKIIAFEPDENNCLAMNYRIERLKREWNFEDSRFEINHYGASDENTISYVERYSDNNGLGSKLVTTQNEKTEVVRAVAIDSAITEEFSFLKADIEGYEYKMLLGAKDGITKYKPKLAICIYHNAVDFYSIPLLIKSINPQYKLAVRHYTHALSDTVLYAFIEE